MLNVEVFMFFFAARSPVFERMFTGSFREATSTEQEVKDVSADVFEEFLYFIYTGDIRNKDFPVEELISVADRYQVSDLMRFCELKLLKSIGDENAEKTFRLANKIHSSNSELKKVAFEVLQSWVKFNSKLFQFLTFLVFRNFNRLKVEMPNDFIDSPEKVFRSLDLKKKLEASLTAEPETEDTSDENEDVALTESIPTFSSASTFEAPSLATLSIQSMEDDINELLNSQ